MSQEIDMTNDVQPTSGAFTLTKQNNGVAILTMDVPGESMNTLKAEFGDEICCHDNCVVHSNFDPICLRNLFARAFCRL